jgi:hypothetical protein
MENKKGVYQVTENPLETSGRPASLYFTSKLGDEVGSEFIADFENPINARLVCKRMNDYAALQAKCERMETELKDIAENEGQCCMRCEGNGKLWADGKAHLPSYDGPTVNCGNCGGSGRIYQDLQGIANEALSEVDGDKEWPLRCIKCGNYNCTNENCYQKEDKQ